MGNVSIVVRLTPTLNFSATALFATTSSQPMQAHAAAMIETPLVRTFLSCAMSRSLLSISPLRLCDRETLIHQPLRNHVGDGIIVLVHHDHMRISPDAEVGKIDHVDLAARGAHRCGVLEIEFSISDPARMEVDIVAAHHEDRDVL